MYRTVSMSWAMYKWLIMLIYYISYIDFGQDLLVTGWYYKGISRTATIYNMKHWLILIRFFLHLDRIGDSVWRLENTDMILSIYGKIRIRESPYLDIFHAVEFFGVQLSRVVPDDAAGILDTPLLLYWNCLSCIST